jgi:hypothetical protein
MVRGGSQHLVEARKERIQRLRTTLQRHTLQALRKYGINKYGKVEGKHWVGIDKIKLIADYCLEQGTRRSRAEEYLQLFIDADEIWDEKEYLFPNKKFIKPILRIVEKINEKRTKEHQIIIEGLETFKEAENKHT